MRDATLQAHGAFDCNDASCVYRVLIATVVVVVWLQVTAQLKAVYGREVLFEYVDIDGNTGIKHVT